MNATPTPPEPRAPSEPGAPDGGAELQAAAGVRGPVEEPAGTADAAGVGRVEPVQGGEARALEESVTALLPGADVSAHTAPDPEDPGLPEVAGITFVLLFAPCLGAVAWIAGAVALLDLGYDHRPWTGTTTVSVAVVVALAGAGLGGLWWRMRRFGAQRPWEMPLVLLVAVVTVLAVGRLRVVWELQDILWPHVVGLWCVGLALAGAVVVWKLPGWRVRPLVAVVLVLAVGAIAVGGSWRQFLAEHEQVVREWAQQVEDAGFAIAVLDDPGWEPVRMRVAEDADGALEVSMVYAPVAEGLAGKGLELWVSAQEIGEREQQDRQEGAGQDLEEASGLEPQEVLWERCVGWKGESSCQEHGAVVVMDHSDQNVPSVWVGMGLAEGVTATLSVTAPTDFTGSPLIGVPSVEEMVELAGQIRPMEGEQAQRVVGEIGPSW